MRVETWLNDYVFTVSEFFSPQECESHIAMSEDIGFEEALVTSERGSVRATSLRNNDRVMFKSPELAQFLWQRAEAFVPEQYEGRRAIGINELIRFYRYEVDQEFKWHQDFPFERDNGEKSYLTMLVYLNNAFEGGETLFDDSCSQESFDELVITPETGLAVFFEHETYHKGEIVTAGTKYVLRSDVMYSVDDAVLDSEVDDFDSQLDDWN